MRRNFFTILVANIWKSLLANVTEADTVNAFKNGLGRPCRMKKFMLDVDFDF